MPSKLFQTATKRQQQSARRVLGRSPIPRLVKMVRSVNRASGGEALRIMQKQLLSREGQRALKAIEQGVRFATRGEKDAALDRLLAQLGPIGAAVRRALGGQKTTEDSYDAAVGLIRSMGGEVLERQGGGNYDRGLEAAQQVLQEAGYEVLGPGERQSLRRPGTRAGGAQATEDEGWIYDPQRKVSSQSVWSYAYSQQTENQGTLYVTFLAWTPGGGKREAPGSTYAYYNVTPNKYRQFSRAAAGSAGEAVWDFLRVRGTMAGHQHAYELVGGVLIQEGGLYVPRKATAEGYMRRTIQDPFGERGQVVRSSLPSREFVDRGEPNRGKPNRGTPRRG